MKTHSEFPASSAARLMACPGSFRLTKELRERGIPPPRPGVYAAQGTVAHAIAEELLSHRGDKVRQSEIRADIEGADQTADGHTVEVDRDFLDHVQTYVDYIETLESFDYDLKFEQRVSPTLPWVETGRPPPIPLFGTADCYGINRKTKDIVVVDLKFGSGIKVDVWENPQLLYYALGVISELAGQDQLAPPTPVELVVIQPRVLGGAEPKMFNTNIAQIVRWGDDVFRPAVERVLKPNAKLEPGGHCKWCPAYAHCPEIQRMAKDKVRTLFDDQSFEDDPRGALQVLSGKSLADDLLLVAILEPWIEALREEAIRRLERGERVAYHKLVAKRAIRKWIDEAASKKAAVAAAEVNVNLMEVSVVSPAQAEKKAPGVDFSPYWIKQSSGNTVAHESDPRPAVSPTPSTLLQDLKGSLQ